MLLIYKNRQVKVGDKVRVYFNLHTSLFSILAIEGAHKGKVVAHGNGIKLVDAKFIINKSGQQRVRLTKTKNVHAYVEGTYKGLTTEVLAEEAYYNPYLTDFFINSKSKEDIFKAKEVILKDKKVNYI